MRKINLEELKKASLDLAKRFPVALAFLAMLTIWSLLNIWDRVYVIGSFRLEKHVQEWFTVTGIQQGTVFYYLSIATILSIVLQFWGEEIKDSKRKLRVSVALHLLLLVDAIFLWFRPEGSITSELVLGHVACCTALVIGGAFLPFFREKDDLATWNLTLRMLCFAGVCPLACGIMAGGLSLLLGSLDTLFNVSINSKWYSTIVLLMMVTVSTLLWMSRLPQGEDKFNRNALTSRFLTGLVRYLFLPLVLGYLIVLYVYGAKIVLSMELPRGGVCYYVHALMVGCLGIEVLLYPLLRKADADGRTANAFEHWLVRWLPVIILPLLVLMTVAIGRRISDYGITVNRLYTLTLNLWYYAVCIGLYITQARRIHWVTLSFASLFLLTSALPVNFCTLTQHSIVRRIERFFETHQQPALPMSADDYEDYMPQLPWQEAEQLREDLRYLRSLYSQDEIARFVADDVNLWQSFRQEDEDRIKIDYEYDHRGSVLIPEGYQRFTRYSEYTTCSREDSTLWHVTINDTLCIAIDIDHLPMEKDQKQDWLLPDLNHSGIHSISSLSLHESWNDSTMLNLSIIGYYFEP